MPVAGPGSEGVTPGAASCSCGAINRLGALFCRTCGASLAKLEPARGSTSSATAPQCEASGARHANPDLSKTPSVAGSSSYIFVAFAVICALLVLIWLGPAGMANTMHNFSIRLITFARTLPRPLGLSANLVDCAILAEPLVGFTVMFIVVMRRERAAAQRRRYLALYLIIMSAMGAMVYRIFHHGEIFLPFQKCESSCVLTALLFTCAALLYVLYALYRRIIWTSEVKQFEAGKRL